MFAVWRWKPGTSLLRKQTSWHIAPADLRIRNEPRYKQQNNNPYAATIESKLPVFWCRDSAGLGTRYVFQMGNASGKQAIYRRKYEAPFPSPCHQLSTTYPNVCKSGFLVSSVAFWRISAFAIFTRKSICKQSSDFKHVKIPVPSWNSWTSLPLMTHDYESLWWTCLCQVMGMVLTQQEEFLKAFFHRDFAKLNVHTVVETCCKCKCYQVITFRANIWSFGPDGRQAAKLSEVPSLLQQSRIAMATFPFCGFLSSFWLGLRHFAGTDGAKKEWRMLNWNRWHEHGELGLFFWAPCDIKGLGMTKKGIAKEISQIEATWLLRMLIMAPFPIFVNRSSSRTGHATEANDNMAAIIFRDVIPKLEVALALLVGLILPWHYF